MVAIAIAPGGSAAVAAPTRRSATVPAPSRLEGTVAPGRAAATRRSAATATSTRHSRWCRHWFQRRCVHPVSNLPRDFFLIRDILVNVGGVGGWGKRFLSILEILTKKLKRTLEVLMGTKWHLTKNINHIIFSGYLLFYNSVQVVIL